MVSVVFFTSIDFRKHAQALTSSPHAHAHAQAHASHLLLCSRTDQLCEAFIAPEPPTPTHHDRDLAGPELPRSTSITIAIAPIGIDREIGSIAIIEISEIAIAIGAITIDADRRCVGDHAVVFGMLADHADRRGANDHADRSLPLSLAECVLFTWVFSFCGSLYLLRVLRKMFEGKTIL